MEICLRVRDDPQLLDKILKVAMPENDESCVMKIENGELIFKFQTDKLASIYSVVDEILKAYEIVKKIEGQDFTPEHQV
jgi:uncharacterized protein (DUF169 family)